MGIAVTLAMYIIGLPQPYMWGAIATVLNYAMYVGPAVMTIILLGVGLLNFPDSLMALAPPLVYIAINGLEGQFVTPAILGNRLTLNPLVVFVSTAFWLWLWGPIGAFLAIPILIIGTMTLYHLVPNINRQRSRVRNAISATRVGRRGL
jgi:predicted PurR-regulated permease PerM